MIPYEYILWNYPPAGTPLLARSLNRAINDTSTMCIVLVDSVNTNKPTGYSDYGSNSAANIAKRVADHLEYQGFTRGLGTAGNGAYGGHVCLLNWGYAAHIPLRGNASDAMPAHAGADGCRFYGIYNGAATATGASTLHEWTTDYMAALKSECDSRNLCYPSSFHMDYEDRPAAQYQVRNDDVAPADPNGVIDEEIADARAGTEVLAQLPANRTFTQLVAEYPAQTFTSTNWYFFGLDNQAWVKLVYLPLENRVHDNAMHRLLGALAIAQFPLTQWSNYQLVEPRDSNFPYRDQANNWMFWYQAVTGTLHATFQQPIAYGPSMSGGSSYDPANNATHGLGTTQREVWRNFTRAQIRSATRGGATRPARSTIETPNTNSGQYGTMHTPTIPDSQWLLTEGYTEGVRSTVIFNPSSPMTAGQATDTLALINNFNNQMGFSGGDSLRSVRVVRGTGQRSLVR